MEEIKDNATNSNKEMSLNQYEYERIKRVNKEVFKVLMEFIGAVEEMLKDMSKITGPFPGLTKMSEILDLMCTLSKDAFQKIEIILEWTKQKEIKEKDGKKDIVRYYYHDVYSAITTPVHNQQVILKKYSKKILIKLRSQEYHRKQFISIREKTKKQLEKLELK